MKKLIILDRDGVINIDSNYVSSPQEWIPIEGSLQAIADLTQAGFTICVATNQSGIARGFYDLQMLDKIHQKMHLEVVKTGGKIDSVFYCPHGPLDNCNCRKPKNGLFHQIQKYYAQSLINVPCIGDSWRDLKAGMSLGGTPILVLTGKGKQTLIERANECKNIPHYPNLLSFSHSFLKHPF